MATGSGKTRKAQKLTDKAIEAMKPDPEGPYRVPDTRAAGLALRVAANGGLTWDLAYRIRGEGVRRLSLGRYEEVGLGAARKRANDVTSAARQGVDLIAKEKAARDERDQSFTVGRLLNEYIRRRVTGRLRTAGEVEKRLKRTLEPIMTRKAADIRRRDLRELFDETADKGFVREPGQRRQTVGTMFKWAVAQDILESNPADGLSSYGVSTPRNRVLDENEIRTLWQWLDDRNISSEVGNILKLQLCLGARCGEIAGMRANEFATDGRGRLIWTLPVERSKNKRTRVTPIVGLAKEIIATQLETSGDVLFPSSSGEPFYSGLVGQHLLSRCLPVAKFTTHDLRRTTATMMAKLEVSLELVATVVGHTTGGSQTNTLVRNYIHSDFVDRKAIALTAWDRRLRSILAGEAGEAGKVVPLRA